MGVGLCAGFGVRGRGVGCAVLFLAGRSAHGLHFARSIAQLLAINTSQTYEAAIVNGALAGATATAEAIGTILGAVQS